MSYDGRRPLLRDALARPVRIASLAPHGAWRLAELLETDARKRKCAPFAEALRRLAYAAELTVDGANDREKLRTVLEAAETERLRFLMEHGGVLDVRGFNNGMNGMAEDADGFPVVVPLRPRDAGGSGR